MTNRTTFLLCAGLLCEAALLGSGCGPSPEPTPPPVTTTTTLAPTPFPSTCGPDLVAPLPGPLGDYVPATWRPSEHLDTVIALRDAVGGCSPSDPYGKLRDTAARLRLVYSLCVVAKDEGLLIEREDGDFEEIYAVTIPTGCFATRDRMYKGVLAWIGAAK